MGKYKIEVTRSAEKALHLAPKNYLPKILAAIQGLSFDPFPAGCRKLAGFADTFRLRVGTYRVIYEFNGTEVTVKILKVGHRKDIYR